MADFDVLRRQLRETRQTRDTADAQAAAAQHRLKRLATERAALDRVFNADNPRHAAERDRLERDAKGAQTLLSEHRQARDRARLDEAAILDLFRQFTDPRTGVARLDDGIPILLMPVRLETRFKQIAGTALVPPRDELWVRVYPDDCWIDAFDPTLTDSEVQNARTYWIGMWQAGGIEDHERGAWRVLVDSHGSGRATWIVSQVQPLNLAQRPTKAEPHDVILTIPTDTPLTPAEEPAAASFWRQVWLADGDLAATDAAHNALAQTVGADRAAIIATRYQPINVAAPLGAGLTKSDVTVSVAFVVFPLVDTKASAWSRAPTITILPDRFVFIGYHPGGSPVIALSNPVPSPLIVGPDPSAAEEDQLQHDDDGNLVVPEELRWMSDFERALDVGMGFRIPLTPILASRGFDRVLVIGVRLNADEHAAKEELEDLFQHHALSRTGLAVVPQGTPTNNTEAAGSGHGRGDDPDRSFDDNAAPLFTAESGWLAKRDGQWIAEYLGLDPARFAHLHDAGATDQRAARAMNVALWPATLGYWMETMMAPVFPPEAIDQTREFFTRYVLGAGPVPALRIGGQPYGVLPATKWSQMDWLTQRIGGDDIPPGSTGLLLYLRQLYPLLLAVDNDWQSQFANVSYTGKAGDPHKILLDIVGLHPGSAEWSQRYAESFETLYNRLNLQGLGGKLEAGILSGQRMLARQLLAMRGFAGDEIPPILDKVFAGAHHLLKGGLIDDRPLSETEGIRAYTASGQNYLEWLNDAAATSLDALYTQDGFLDDKPPRALLYLLLRHALQLGYHDVSIRLHEQAGLYSPAMALAARRDDPFLHVRDNQLVSESRYQPLYAVVPAITGSPQLTVGEFIATQLTALAFASYVRRQRAALDVLEAEPTARLERAFADHIDCCSYRLDAWLMGIAAYQLSLMRRIGDGHESAPRQGLYLGAYAWIEELRPEHKVLTPVGMRDPDLIEDFTSDDGPPLMRDSTNQGYVHAPSLNHAVAAAILRNGFISNASAENRQTMAINLTSERVRTALALLEGIRAGQGLADLLGYQFERGLHDRHALAEVDKFIYELRREFPLRANKMKSTRAGPGVPIEAIEARNVLDGLALVEHVRNATDEDDKVYPFGKADLPSATPAEAAAINAEVDRLIESQDAVADLALSEGVYQAVIGNYDRVASTYDAYARGHFPPEPDVIRTPYQGIGLTHRVGLHLAAGANPTVSPIAGLDPTPRAQAEPALNNWYATILPLLDLVACVVSFREAASGATLEREVTLRQLDLQPADLLALVRDDPRQAMTELDDRIVRFAVTSFAPRPDVPVTIRYMQTQTAPFSLFELMPLLRHVRRLTTQSRPLRVTDLTLMNEAQSGQDDLVSVDKQRLVLVQIAMQDARNDLDAFRTQLQGPLGDLENRRAEILADVDDYVADAVPLLARAALFAVPQAGWGFAYDFQRLTYAGILKQCADVVARWDARLVEFDARMAEYDALVLAGTATDDELFDVLIKAERSVSAIAALPLPATPAAFRTLLVTVKQPALVAKRDQCAAMQNTTRTRVSLLLTDVTALLPIADFDTAAFTWTAHEEQMIRFAEDAVAVCSVVVTALERRIAASQVLFDDHDATAAAAGRVRALEKAAKALLGEDFRIIPEITLSAAQGDELGLTLAASRSGSLFAHLTAPPDPTTALEFPVDTWLYGLARVREKMQAWEQMTILAGALDRPEPALDAMQLPFVPDDRWLGLDLAPDQALDQDRLLYTAHFANPVFDKTAPQCGLLLDDWTEVIPGETADTGITFHHDRPNSEAPQAMLLVTPSEFRGAWRWDDLVDALNETLDFAKRRAIEPAHIDATSYAPFLPATIVATQVAQLTIAANLALNNAHLLTITED